MKTRLACVQVCDVDRNIRPPLPLSYGSGAMLSNRYFPLIVCGWCSADRAQMCSTICTLLTCGVLHCAMLRCATPPCALKCCVMLCCRVSWALAASRSATVRRADVCCAVLCCAVSCYAVLQGQLGIGSIQKCHSAAC